MLDGFFVTVNCTGKMGFRPNNLMTKAFIMKFVELVSFSCVVQIQESETFSNSLTQ